MKEDDSVRIKVKPYPIPFELAGGPKVIPGLIIRLSLIGFVSNMDKEILQVSEKFIARFEIPMLHNWIAAPVIVFKTQDQIRKKYDAEQRRNVGMEVVRLTELHFQNLDAESRLFIQKFMTAIGQSE